MDGMKEIYGKSPTETSQGNLPYPFNDTLISLFF